MGSFWYCSVGPFQHSHCQFKSCMGTQAKRFLLLKAVSKEWKKNGNWSVTEKMWSSWKHVENMPPAYSSEITSRTGPKISIKILRKTEQVKVSKRYGFISASLLTSLKIYKALNLGKTALAVLRHIDSEIDQESTAIWMEELKMYWWKTWPFIPSNKLILALAPSQHTWLIWTQTTINLVYSRPREKHMHVVRHFSLFLHWIIATSKYHTFRGQCQVCVMLEDEACAGSKQGEAWIWVTQVWLLLELYMPLIGDCRAKVNE